MKNLFILIFVVASTTLFSQQCYTDATLLATDGERGQLVSFIFSNDFQYFGTDTNDSGLYVGKIQKNGNKIIFPDKNYIVMNDKYFVYYLDGKEFSYLKKHECNIDYSKQFDKILNGFKKINGY